MPPLTDRFSEYQLLTVLLPLVTLGGFVGYPVLQALAIWRMPGRWRLAAFLPLLVLGASAVYSSVALFQLQWWVSFAPLLTLSFLYLAALWLGYLWHTRTVKIVSLIVVTAGLMLVASRQGIGWKLGAPPSKIEGEFKTEGAWIVTEIARDIGEMLTFDGGASAAPSILVEHQASGIYVISSSERLAKPIQLDLREGLWNPERFAPLASGFLGSGRPSVDDQFASVHEGLLNAAPDHIVSTAAAVSRALSLAMRNARVHEAAALTIGAFELREASGHFQDPRWALNRMTAHLAIARALSPGSDFGIDGALADSVRLALSNEQEQAIGRLDRLDAGPDSASVRPWTKALRVRMTEDWRLIEHPAAATLLEKSEYLRARRKTAGSTRAMPDFEALGIDPNESAHWIRIIQNGHRGVEEGHLIVAAGVPLEEREASEVLSQMSGSPRTLTVDDLNARATRCLTLAGPVLLPWGAWAEFFQRHLAMLIGTANRQFTKGLGDEEGGVGLNVAIDSRYRRLALFPVATTFRLKGVKGSEADLRYINEAIDVGITQPERLTSEAWGWLQRASAYEPLRRGMPSGNTWFGVPALPFDARFRAALPARGADAASLDAALANATSDYYLALADLGARYGEKPPLAEIQRLLGSRFGYDLRATSFALEHASSDEEKITLLTNACSVSASECGPLAGMLARKGRDDEAARMYEKAFADPYVDHVGRSNSSGWLVNYYYRHNRTRDAMDLAAAAADVGSQTGLETMAWLDEKLGFLEEAEEFYVRSAERYDDPTRVLGFYLRRSLNYKDKSVEPRMKEWMTKVFPEGLQSAPAALNQKPDRGVIIVGDSDRSRKIGIQAGDIIVGLEGQRVDNLKQYYAINAWYETDDMKITLWRGRIFQVTTTSPNRLVGIQLRSYPIQGWAE